MLSGLLYIQIIPETHCSCHNNIIDICLPSSSLRFIQPCRSLCVAVRDSCAPVLACQGRPWPEALNCDRFPAEEDMCLTPHAKLNHFAKGKSHTVFFTIFATMQSNVNAAAADNN